MPTIVVEDGSIVQNANSYASLEYADAYHADRGNSQWANADDAAKASALIVASEFIDRKPWKGRRTGADNPMAWPRQEVYDSDGYLLSSVLVPAKVKQATVEVALRIITGLDINPDLDNAGSIKSQTVGSISIVYGGGAIPVPEMTIVTRLLSDLTASRNNTKMVLG